MIVETMSAPWTGRWGVFFAALAMAAALARCGTGKIIGMGEDSGADASDADVDSDADGLTCGAIACPSGTECVAGTCVPGNPCEGIECETVGEVCSHGTCVSGGLDADEDGFPARDDCDDEDPEVFPGTTRECLTECGEGLVTCQAGALWSECSAPTTCTCTRGESLEEPCGRCGTAVRECEEGEWGPLGECTGEGECSLGATEVRDCDSCSREERSCGDACRWSSWGACESTGDCVAGRTEACTTSCGSPGTRTCSPTCFWGGCTASSQESGSAACHDGVDNDCDGQTDCADSACAGVGTLEVCGAVCGDGIDNDCQDGTDCADIGCQGCCPYCGGGGAENNASACHDGEDNDCDGQTDCADSECYGQGTYELCSGGASLCGDGIDNDCMDGTDCADWGCEGCCPYCSGTEGDVATCHDGLDNDCDGLPDCSDGACYGVGTYELCSSDPSLCWDGVDNDCMDGWDCADWGCEGCC